LSSKRLMCFRYIWDSISIVLVCNEIVRR